MDVCSETNPRSGSDLWHKLQRMQKRGTLGAVLGVQTRNLSALARMRNESATTIRKVFREVDFSEDGLLSKSEFSQVMKRIEGKTMKTKVRCDI